MIRNYLLSAFRHIGKQKALSFINILSLSIGLACFSLFLLYTINELSFDRFNANADRINRVYRWSGALDDPEAERDPYLPMPLGPALKDEFPEVENFVRYQDAYDQPFVRIDGRVDQEGLAFADRQIFEVFTFPFLYGNPATALDGLGNVVINEKTALRLFGQSNAVGRKIDIKVEQEFQPFTVSGVIRDIPGNSSIQFNMVSSFDQLQATSFGKRSIDNWRRSAYQTFILLRPGSRLASETDRLLAFRKKFYPNEESEMRDAGYWKGEGPPVRYRMQALREIHLDPDMYGGSVPSVDPQNIWILLGIAMGVLLIACINFTTLAIGRSAGRAKEVGVRKVMGGKRGQLVGQFLTESVLFSVFSAGLGIALAALLLPSFNALSGRELAFSLQSYPELAWLFGGIALLSGLLAGAYPALVLSGFQPVAVLKSKLRLGGANLFTKSLVTLQFVLSIGLIMSTLVILQQLRMMRDKNPGFNKENVIVVDAEGTDTKTIYPRFKQALAGQPGIISVAASELGLGEGQGWSRSGFDYKGELKQLFEYYVDADFLPTLGLELIAGRNFDPAMGQDTLNSFIVNEAAVKDFGWTLETAVGQEFTGYFEDDRPNPVVIGVVKDFNFRPLSEEVAPQVFHQFADYRPFKFFVRINPGDPAPALETLQQAWTGVVPELPFLYSFLDEDLNRFYRAEERWSNIVGWAGGISIFLACLGLFGLAALAAVNRTKEVGIRKVLGASLAGIVGLLSRDFIRLVVLALVIATPLAWYFMRDWLDGFAYRIDLGTSFLSVALGAGLSAVAIAFLTVGIQAARAALVNPVESLKDE